MNIYAITEDNEVRLYAAPNMAAAIERSWQDTLVDETERRGEPLTEEQATEERADWEQNVLQSCTFVGDLENVGDFAGHAAVAAAYEAAAQIAEDAPFSLEFDPGISPTAADYVRDTVQKARHAIAAAIRATKAGARAP